MANLQVRNLDYLRSKDPRLAEALSDLQTAINALGVQTNTAPVGVQVTPAAPSQLNVTASGGIFDVQIQDNNPSNTKLAPDYFIEYSTTASFNQPIVKHLGPSRNWRATLGAQTLYFRAYSQHGRASAPSAHVYYGSQANPTPVGGGGTTSGPPPQPSAGSGTSPTNGLTGGVGYGLPERQQ